MQNLTIATQTNRFPQITTAISIAVLAIHLIPGLTELLAFDKLAVLHSELWRPVTGHFTHWSWSHLAWDLLAFAVLGTIVERQSRSRLLSVILTSAILISAWVWLAEPSLDSYRGLSGIDSALFVAAAIGIWRDARGNDARSRRWLAGGAAVAFVAKSVVELASGRPLFVDQTSAEFVPVFAAHFLGAVAGLLISLPWRWLKNPMAGSPQVAGSVRGRELRT